VPKRIVIAGDGHSTQIGIQIRIGPVYSEEAALAVPGWPAAEIARSPADAVTPAGRTPWRAER